MADKVKKLIRPIKDICEKIEKSDDAIDPLLADLKAYIRKDKFYESHSQQHLQALLKQLDGNSSKIEPILRVLNEILSNSEGNYSINLSNLYKFLIDMKDKSDFQRQIINSITFRGEQTNFENMKTLLMINKLLLTYCLSDDCDTSLSTIVIKNIRSIITNNIEEEQNQIFVFNIVKEMISFASPKLSEELLLCIINVRVKIEAQDVFNAYASLMQEGTRKIPVACSQYAASMQLSLKTESHKNANEILQVILRTFSNTSVNANGLKAIRSAYKKHKTDENVQIVTRTLLFLLKEHKNYEITSDCFLAFHSLIYDLLHVVTKITDKKGVFPCCSDIKRHEIHSLLMRIFPFAENLINDDKYKAKEAAIVDFYINYAFQLCKEIKCEEKNAIVFVTYSQIYNRVLYAITFKKQSIVNPAIKEISKAFKVCISLYNMLTGEYLKKSTNPFNLLELIVNVSYTVDQAPYFADCYAQLLLFKLKDNNANKKVQNLLKDFYPLRKAARKMNLQGAANYLSEKNLDKELTEVSMDYVKAVEMNTIARFTSAKEGTIQMSGLFRNLCMNENLDVSHFALACQAISIHELKNIDMERFEELNEKLEKHSKALDKIDLYTSLALATNFYYLFCLEKDRMYKMFVENGALKGKIECGSYSKIVEHCDCQSEAKILGHLEKSMEHFCNVILCIRKHDKDEEQKIISHTRLQRILINISSHYFARGIGYKDIEAQNLLWNFCNEITHWTTILNCATELIDNHFKILESSGQSMMLSRKIETVDIREVLTKSHEIIQTAIQNFDKSKEIEQVCLLNHLLSLYRFYALKRQSKKSKSSYLEFYRLWESSKLKENSMYSDTFEAKARFSKVQINDECFNTNSFDLLFSAYCQIREVKSVTAEFTNVYRQVFQQVSMYTINYVINRMDDMMRYEQLVITIKAHTLTSQYFFRALEATSMSAFWNLQMEKLNFAMNDLKELSALLGIHEEILIKTPSKIESEVPELALNGYLDLTVRKSIQVSKQAPQIMYPRFQIDLLNQLKKFVHSDSCKCSHCQYPFVKFSLFQVGCHYSRLLWLMEKFSISKAFNDFALDHWRVACQKVLRSKESDFLNVDKRKFIVFSIRWLFQVSDTLISLDQYEEAMDIYNEVELICTPIIPDYKCFMQMLYCRKNDLKFLLANGKDMDALETKRNKGKVELTFEDFKKYRETVGKSIKTPEPSEAVNFEFTPTTSHVDVRTLRPVHASRRKSPCRTPATSSTQPTPRSRKKISPKNESIICIDSSDEEKKPKTAKPKKPPVQNVLSAPAAPRSTRKATAAKSATNLHTPSSSRTRRMI